jgi:transposase InsO family protein
VKYGFIAEHRKQFPVRSMCRMLEVSRAGYYAWSVRSPSARVRCDLMLLGRIRQVHAAHREAYGAVKTWHALRALGVPCGKHRVARLRREGGIQARRTRRFRASEAHRFTAPAAPDRLQRHFSAASPDQIWAGDMTFIATREGWLHLAVLLDLCTAQVVGWGMGSRPDEAVPLQALEMALLRRRPPPGLIHHTDRGVLYRARRYASLLQQAGACPSMNGTDRPIDNAVAESFFSTLKNELVHHCDFRTRNHAKAAIFDYIEGFYNRTRLHQGLGYRTPLEAEREARDP